MILFPKCICEASPAAYFSKIAELYGGENDFFLMNPSWTDAQRSSADALVQEYFERSREGRNGASSGGRIFIASGGSGGRVRFIAHTPQTLEASAYALSAMLGLPAGTPLNCFCCLPPYHVSGLMTFVRSRVSGGKMFLSESGSFREEETLPEFRGAGDGFWMNSLVPTQLRRLTDREDGAAWLRRFDFVLLGGARVPADLIERARLEGIKFGIGYGMTETASLVALWRPEDGEQIAGTPLPHASFFVSGKIGRIEIAAKSLGQTLSEAGTLLPNPGGRFATNDEGFSDSRGRLVVCGRADRYINSGGEKIDPQVVENALRGVGVSEVLVVGEPDAEWGERVVALVREPVPENLSERVRRVLPSWMMPKRIVPVSALPFDGKGKPDRSRLRELLG